MRIGLPKEAKPFERRVCLTPHGVGVLARAGHQLTVCAGAGEAVGYHDEAYRAAGARIAPDLSDLYAESDFIVKVKELQPEEYALLRPDHLLFCYLHLAASRETAEAMARAGCTGIAFETVTDASGRLPLLAPMSRIAGRLAVLEAAHYLTTAAGGRGLMPGGMPGTERGLALILGAGAAGSAAAETASALGMETVVMDVSVGKLEALEARLGARCSYLLSSPEAAAERARSADIVIGAALIPGAAAPKLLSRAATAGMKPGSVFADIAIDQGGCAETSRVTTLGDPVYTEYGVIHYCPANIPSLAARTASAALEAAVLPYAQRLAELGMSALDQDAGLRAGLNVRAGEIVCPAVRAALGL